MRFATTRHHTHLGLPPHPETTKRPKHAPKAGDNTTPPFPSSCLTPKWQCRIYPKSSFPCIQCIPWLKSLSMPCSRRSGSDVFSFPRSAWECISPLPETAINLACKMPYAFPRRTEGMRKRETTSCPCLSVSVGASALSLPLRLCVLREVFFRLRLCSPVRSVFLYVGNVSAHATVKRMRFLPFYMAFRLYPATRRQGI